MTQQPLSFDAPPARKRKPSLTDKLEAYLLSRSGHFVRVSEMADVVGHSGVRQRRLECEKRGVWLRKTDSGLGEYRLGAYGFVVLGYRQPNPSGRALGRVYRP